MSHLAYIVEPSARSGFVWTVFNRYTGAEIARDYRATYDGADAEARAAIADLLSR